MSIKHQTVANLLAQDLIWREINEINFKIKHNFYKESCDNLTHEIKQKLSTRQTSKIDLLSIEEYCRLHQQMITSQSMRISWTCKIFMCLLPSIYLNLTPSVMWWCQWWQGPEPGRVWRAGRGRDHRQWCAGARSVLAEVPTTASRDPRTRAATFAAKMWLHWSLVSRARRCVNRAVNEISWKFSLEKAPTRAFSVLGLVRFCPLGEVWSLASLRLKSSLHYLRFTGMHVRYVVSELSQGY